MDRPILYWISGSPCAWRVMLGLMFKGISFDSRHLDYGAGENRQPEYLALNPKGQVPILVVGDLVIRESIAILAWLDGVWPARPIWGDTTNDAASGNLNHIGRDNHIRTADYLNVTAFLTVTFEAGDIAMGPKTKGVMNGTMTVLGIPAPIEFEFSLVSDRQYPDFIPNYDVIRVTSFAATGTINQTNFGMNFIVFPGSPTGVEIDLDIKVDPVDCSTVPPQELGSCRGL